MVSLTSLWLPIVLSAVIVFVASSIMHMVLPYHRGDLQKLPDEDGVLDMLRRINVPRGDYGAPLAGSMAAMKDPVFVEKMKRGPWVMMTVVPGGSFSMGPSLAQWFVYCVIVSIFAAYIASRALAPGAPYPQVQRFAGCVAFAGYSLALMQTSIWGRRRWMTTFKGMFDGLIYALLTGGTLGWLWPR